MVHLSGDEYTIDRTNEKAGEGGLTIVDQAGKRQAIRDHERKYGGVDELWWVTSRRCCHIQQ